MSHRTVGRFQICRGDEFNATFKFRSNEGFDPIDFTDLDEVKFAFKKVDGTQLVISSEDESPQVAVSGVSESGNVIINLTEEQTSLLRVGNGQNIEVSYEINGVTKVLVLEKVLDVVTAFGV